MADLLGYNGCKHVSSSDGANTFLNWFGFVVQEDTVLTVLTGNVYSSDGGVSTSTNLLTSLNLSGKTLKAGAYIPAIKNGNITAITLSSGSVIGYLNS